jgi:hypothetical protein
VRGDMNLLHLRKVVPSLNSRTFGTAVSVSDYQVVARNANVVRKSHSKAAMRVTLSIIDLMGETPDGLHAVLFAV